MDFVSRFLTEYIDTKDTLYAHSNALQTCAKASRSLGDIYRITKFYFPKVTLKQVKIKIQEMVTKKEIGGQYCNKTKKFVHYPNTRGLKRNFKTPRPDGKGGVTTVDEHGWEFEYFEKINFFI